MASKPAQKRLSKEFLEMQRSPPPFVWASPEEKNILNWNFILRGPPDCPYAGGEYHGLISFPSDYPFKPPGIKMFTPSGRFQPDKKICCSMTDSHPGTWNPAWSVATICTGLLCFMLSDEIAHLQNGTSSGSVPTLQGPWKNIFSVTPSDAEKRDLALHSHEWNCGQQRFRDAFPEYCGEEMKDLPNMGERDRGATGETRLEEAPATPAIQPQVPVIRPSDPPVAEGHTAPIPNAASAGVGQAVAPALGREAILGSDTTAAMHETTLNFPRIHDPSTAERTSWNSEDTNNQGSSQAAAALAPPSQTTEEPVRVLIVGPSRSGKTYTIDGFRSRAAEPMVYGLYDATKHIITHHLKFEEREFELIDTPGFDNIDMRDVEAFVEITGYLLNLKRMHKGVAGIIYIHRAGNTLHSRSLLRNFRVLTDIFLGTTGVTRLTFLVTQSGTHAVDHGRVMDEMRTRDSAFSAALSAGATIASSPNRTGFAAILRSYLSEQPIILPIQLDHSYQSYPTFVAQAERELGYHYELKHNTEPNQVAQRLDNLNCMIDDAGRSLSAHLTSDYVLATFGKDPSSVTALDAVDLPSLKTLLGHVDGKSSLIVSSGGHGMPIERFFDYSIRSLICHYLTKSIFEPFHPGISSTLNRSLLETYKKLQKQDPQASVGKWRSEMFRSVCDPYDSDATGSNLELHLNRLVDNRLKPLTKHVLGFDVVLEEEHQALLRCLIMIALEWNSILKGSNLVFEDFVPTAFRHPCPLNLELMEDFEAKIGGHGSVHILGTLALGLQSRIAVGGGNPVEQKTIYKALVITSNVYTYN